MVAVLAVELVIAAVSIFLNVTTGMVQQAYARSDAFRKHFDDLYNQLNEEYQSKMRDATPTSSSAINQKNFVQTLMYQRYGQNLNRLRTEFNQIEAKYDDKTRKPFVWASDIDKLTNQESAEKALKLQRVKDEGAKMQKASDEYEMYSRRPSSYGLMMKKKQGKENKNA